MDKQIKCDWLAFFRHCADNLAAIAQEEGEPRLSRALRVSSEVAGVVQRYRDLRDCPHGETNGNR